MDSPPHKRGLILLGDHPILRMQCTPVEAGENLGPLLETMRLACKASKTGVGLAAAQVGVPKRVIMTWLPGGNGKKQATFYLNPQIVRYSEATNVEPEACLSYPGITKYIRRSTSILLVWECVQRRPHREWINGFAARVIQHENDHCNGICKVGDPEYKGEPAPLLRRLSPRAVAAMLQSVL